MLSVPVAPEPGNERVPRRVHGLADRSSGGGHGRREPRRPRARGALQPLRLQAHAMRIAFDVSPLSHPLLGIGNYIQGSLAGLAEASAGTPRDRRLRADEHPRPEADPRGARGHRRRAADLAAALSRTRCAPPGAGSVVRPPSGSSARSTPCTSRTGCTRRSARVSARRRSTTSCRSTIPSGRPRARDRCTAASTGTPPRRATSSS